MKPSRLVDFHHRRFFQPITGKQIALEVGRLVACGLLFGCVVAWAWTS